MADHLPSGNGDFPAVPSHGGQFIQYNIFGNLFEITNKYRPPIMPIGRGAYGIVWYVVFQRIAFAFCVFDSVFDDRKFLQLRVEFGDERDGGDQENRQRFR